MWSILYFLIKKKTTNATEKCTISHARETNFVRVFCSCWNVSFANSFWNFPLDMFINDSIEYKMNLEKRVASGKKKFSRKFNLLNEGEASNWASLTLRIFPPLFARFVSSLPLHPKRDCFGLRKFIFVIQIYSHPKYMTKNAGKFSMETNFVNGLYL